MNTITNADEEKKLEMLPPYKRNASNSFGEIRELEKNKITYWEFTPGVGSVDTKSPEFSVWVRKLVAAYRLHTKHTENVFETRGIMLPEFFRHGLPNYIHPRILWE